MEVGILKFRGHENELRCRKFDFINIKINCPLWCYVKIK